MRYSPSIPTSINCNLITYHDQDVTDSITSGPDALNVALAHRGAVQHAANMPQRISCSPPKETLWTSQGTTSRLDAFGRVVVVQRQAPVNFNGEPLAAGTPLGDLVLDWEADFSIANLEPQAAATLGPITTYLKPLPSGNGLTTDPFSLKAGEWALIDNFVLKSGASSINVDCTANEGVQPVCDVETNTSLEPVVTLFVIQGPVTNATIPVSEVDCNSLVVFQQ